jgi:hypothetical protein
MLNQRTFTNHRYATLAEIKAVANANVQTLCFCEETETLYRYDLTSGATADDERILITGAGGTTRWIGIAGQYVLATLGGTGITLGFGAAMGGGDVGKYYQPHGDANGGKFTTLTEESQIAVPFTGIIYSLSWIADGNAVTPITNAVLKIWVNGVVSATVTVSGSGTPTGGASSPLNVSVTAGDFIAVEYDAVGTGTVFGKSAIEVFVRSL